MTGRQTPRGSGQPPRRDVDEEQGMAGGTRRGAGAGFGQPPGGACGPSYRYDSLTRLQLEKKEDMRRRGVASPDEWDAVALTFAEPVYDRVAGIPKRKLEWVV